MKFYFYSMTAKDSRCGLVGTLEWAGPYCFTDDISLVTGQPGGVNPKHMPNRAMFNLFDDCPKCHRSTNALILDGLEPDEETAQDEAKHKWPVRFCRAFHYDVPMSQLMKFNADTALIDENGVRMTFGSFKKNVLPEVKFHYTK